MNENAKLPNRKLYPKRIVNIPKNYYSNLSCYEDFVIRTNLLGYDVSDGELYDYFDNIDYLNHYAGSDVKTGYNGLYFFAVGDDSDRHLCIINRCGKPVENAIVDGDFDCSRMKLTSLRGSPNEVKGSFFCLHNSINSLNGAPIKVQGDFVCSRCYSLKSLAGISEIIGRDFVCYYCNSLKSLDGITKNIGGKIYSSLDV